MRCQRRMPIFWRICVLLLFAGPACSNQLVFDTAAETECSPGEPDSLQISWTEPCDKGEWLFDTEHGCRMWDLHPEPEDKAVWHGACRAGLPDGPGKALWTEHGRPIDRFMGTYRNGKRAGPGRYQWTETVGFEGSYANDLPQGTGTVYIDDVVLRGQWNRGCLTIAGRTVAISVPRSSCVPDDSMPKVVDR